MKLEDLVEKHHAFVAALDIEKSCSTCVYFEREESEHPCCDCYSFLLGFPVNPTKWRGQTADLPDYETVVEQLESVIGAHDDRVAEGVDPEWDEILTNARRVLTQAKRGG